MRLNNKAIELLNNSLKNWQITEADGEYRYQGTPIGQIVGFYGYADTPTAAVDRLLTNAKAVK
jgi:hypothetical protein